MRPRGEERSEHRRRRPKPLAAWEMRGAEAKCAIAPNIDPMYSTISPYARARSLRCPWPAVVSWWRSRIAANAPRGDPRRSWPWSRALGILLLRPATLSAIMSASARSSGVAGLRSTGSGMFPRIDRRRERRKNDRRMKKPARATRPHPGPLEAETRTADQWAAPLRRPAWSSSKRTMKAWAPG